MQWSSGNRTWLCNGLPTLDSIQCDSGDSRYRKAMAVSLKLFPIDQEGFAMANGSSSWNAIMQYSFLRIFANDGTIDTEELAMLERLAMADGEIDDRERSVLANIFARVNPETVREEVWHDIVEFKTRHQIP